MGPFIGSALEKLVSSADAVNVSGLFSASLRLRKSQVCFHRITLILRNKLLFRLSTIVRTSVN